MIPNEQVALQHAEDISQWIAHRVREAGARGVVIGISGGIDSAVCAALAHKALGQNTLGLLLPCHSSPADLQDARRVAQHIGLPVEEIDLSPVFDAFLHALGPADPKLCGNLKARLRMATLYHRAASHHYLVLGTSNRSEWEIGYFTKHADGAADLQPIIHLLKGEVRILARALELPREIIERPPSAGLWEGQTDEGELGFTYEQLDSFLQGQVEAVDPQVAQKIRTLQEASAHKRMPPPRFLGLPQADGTSADKSVEALTLISKAITSEHYLEDILRLIVMVTAEVMNSSVCSLWLLDEKAQALRLRATQAINPEYVKDRTVKVGEGVVGKVVVEDRPYVALDVLKDPYFKEKELARRLGLVSMLSMPMRVKDRVIGVINCYTSFEHHFTDLEKNVLTAVANQAAVAIENTELLVQTRVIQEELEKRKIIDRAKDLLMDRLQLSGEEAYRWIQKKSMDSRRSMREVAEAVLLTFES
ncbi:NAD+ synthetase [Desulfacinum hydrothermale DSM 13146]|uniref:NH(3)-dependent NAD(+) synthetase n=1 Tax=Desulfacinum hydrothermale DSM 13146 TaxID=1121390 RepID=A0A1W1X1V6_9BACT|nr:NAD(+) synthase [Desulfacinum hydrothermale]SMC17912.1 NAD+ synthetase [Desulfacinum hydrothermale DSM 13146]